MSKSEFAALEKATAALSSFAKSETVARALHAPQENIGLLHALARVIPGAQAEGMTWENLRALYRAAAVEKGYARAIRKAICELARNPRLALNCAPAHEDAYIRGKLSAKRKWEEGERNRACDGELKERKTALFAELEKHLFPIIHDFKKRTQEAVRRPGAMKDYIQEFFSEPTIAEKIVKAYGFKPSFATFYRDALAFMGPSDPFLVVKAQQQRRYGVEAPYAGAHFAYDGSCPPVLLRVKGERLDKTERNWLHVRHDNSSGNTRVYVVRTNSEAASWSAPLWYFLEKDQFIPEIGFFDKVSGLAAVFDSLKSGDDPQNRFKPALLLMIAGGMYPYTHVPGNPRGKAHIESGINQLKKMIIQLLTRRALRMRIHGEREKYAYEFETRAAMEDFVKQAEAELNARPIFRKQSESRDVLWQRGAEARQARALAPDWQTRMGEIFRDTHISTLADEVIKVKSEGRVSEGEITQFYDMAGNPIERPQFMETPKILSMPYGILASDAGKEGYRVLVIEPRKGQPKIYRAEARAVALTAYNERGNKSEFGTFRAMPDTPERRRVGKIQSIVAADEKERRKAAEIAAALAGKLPGQAAADALPAPVESQYPTAEEELNGRGQTSIYDIVVG